MSSLDPEPGRLFKGSFSFFEDDLRQLDALALQRKRKKGTELQREAMHNGTLFECIREEPDAATGMYGNLTVEQVARMIRPLIVLGADWLEQHGYPLHPTGGGVSADALTSLLGALAANQGRGGMPQGGEAGAAQGSTKKPGEGAYIQGKALEGLALDEEEIL